MEQVKVEGVYGKWLNNQRQKRHLFNLGDGSSELANIEDCGFCQELTRLSVFNKTAELLAKRLSPLLPPSPSPPPPQTPLPQTPETLAEHIEKAQKILDFLFEGRSTDEVMFRATMSILFAYKEVIPGDDLLFLAIYQELMTLFLTSSKYCTASCYWRWSSVHLEKVVSIEVPFLELLFTALSLSLSVGKMAVSKCSRKGSNGRSEEVEEEEGNEETEEEEEDETEVVDCCCFCCCCSCWLSELAATSDAWIHSSAMSSSGSSISFSGSSALVIESTVVTADIASR